MLRILTIACMIAAVAGTGCDAKKSSGSGGRTADSTKNAGDPTHPGEPPREGKWWNVTEVKAYIKDSLGLTDLNLIPAKDNGFTGTGRNPAGTLVKLKVTQVPGKITCE